MFELGGIPKGYREQDLVRVAQEALEGRDLEAKGVRLDAMVDVVLSAIEDVFGVVAECRAHRYPPELLEKI